MPAAAGGVRWPARLRLEAICDASCEAAREASSMAGSESERGLSGSGADRIAVRRGATRVHAAHEGPLRLLKTLYPEGPGIAHAVLVHPPGGLVGGDRLDIDIHVATGAHLLVTTPAASRYYRSTAGEAAQVVQAQVAAGARLEWLPQETLAYDGCQGRNAWQVRLDAGGSLMTMEVLALGLGESQRPFASGRFVQQFGIEGEGEGGNLPSGLHGGFQGGIQHSLEGGLWRERGVIDATDRALLDGPCGLAGHRVLGTLLLAEGAAIDGATAEAALDAARAESAAAPGMLAGATWLQERVLVLRLLADEVEPAMRLLRRVRARWRHRCWGMDAHEPRVWAS